MRSSSSLLLVVSAKAGQVAGSSSHITIYIHTATDHPEMKEIKEFSFDLRSTGK